MTSKARCLKFGLGFLLMAGVILLGLPASPSQAGTVWTMNTLDHRNQRADLIENHEISLVLNGDNPVISYRDAINRDLKLAVCYDPTCSTRTITTVDSAGDVGAHNSIALNGLNPVISYYDRTNMNLKLAICNNPTCTAPTLLTLDSVGNVGYFTSLVLDGDKPVISYTDETNADLKLASCDNAACSSFTITTVDSMGKVGRHTSLELNEGNPVISYYNSDNYDLKLVICSDPTCSFSPYIQTIDSIGYVGSDTSLALNGDNPVISYLDHDPNYDLRLAVCHDTLCSTSTIQTLDSQGYVGWHSSLALDGSNPVIGYFDNSNGDLKLITCNDPACNTRDMMSVDGVGSAVGVYPSLALTGSRPVIAYLDIDNSGLKLATKIPAAVNVTPALLTVSEPTGTTQFSFTLNANPGNDVSIPLSSTDTSECTVPASISLNSSNWSTGATVTVTAVDDPFPDGDQTCIITTGIITGSSTGFDGLDPADVTITVQDRPVPTLLLPADQDSLSSVMLTWEALQGATGYEIQLSTSQTPTTIISAGNTTSYQPAYPLLPTTYYWRVRALIGEQASGWSVLRVFTLTGSTDSTPFLTHYTTPRPTLTWGRVSWATGYEIQVSESATFETLAFSTTVSGGTPQIETTPLSNGHYFWRVRAQHGNGTWGAWSPASSFVVDAP